MKCKTNVKVTAKRKTSKNLARLCKTALTGFARNLSPGQRHTNATTQELSRHQRYLHILNQFSIEMVSLMSKDALYWHVAREVVARLGFGDCVVYELLPSRATLVQRAAIGAKNPEGENIVNLLKIPVGKGITGTVAATGKPLIIGDLAEDERYLPDLEPARSEICVPIIYNEAIVGVIDCEDSQPNIFNQSHLEILTTVASLLGSKLAQCQVHAQLESSNIQLSEEIRERKHAESALKQHRDALEDIVSNRTQELQKSLDKLRRETEERRQAELHLRENQAMLVQSEKMASIGNLIAGIAHEINNPVAYISSNLHVLKEYVNDLRPLLNTQSELVEATLEGNGNTLEHASSARKLLGTMHVEELIPELDDLLSDTREGVERVEKIVADLRDYAYQRGDETEPVCINALLNRTLRVAANEIKYKAEIICDFADLPMIPCCPGRLSQVFLNLLVNSAQAIESHGTIQIQTLQRDTSIMIRIVDTGVGMPEEVLSQIFDPFFTTKEVGQGTGLGLHIVHNIIDTHGGKIHAQSKVGIGTSFTIELPVASDVDKELKRVAL